MIIRKDSIPKHLNTAILVNRDVESLIESDNKLHELGNKPKLLVWEKGFSSPELVELFNSNVWPIELLKDLSAPGWDWDIETGDEQKSKNPSDILEWTRRAAGIEDPPNGNIKATLSIRDYQDRESLRGGYEWWNDRVSDINANGKFGRRLLQAILSVLEKAMKAGSTLFVEQISILLSKDSSQPIASLVPTLHSDQYYGHRESAICSFLEKDYNDFGGAMFLFEKSMKDLWDLRPIKISNLLQDLNEYPVMASESGDILIFDGMIGMDGKTNPDNGVPHISSDISGRSARLAILMLHSR